MYKYLLTALTLLITLVATSQSVYARTAPMAPKAPTIEKKYYGIWQKMTLINLLRKQAGDTVTITQKTTYATRTAASPRRTGATTPQTKIATPTLKPAAPTAAKAKTTTAPSTTESAPANDVTGYIMKEINDYRASQGLGAVQTSTETCNFAASRAQEITTNFTHDGFSQRRDNKTLPYASWSAITENIAMTSNFKDVVTMWKNSSGHAANMRADTPYVCVMQHGDYYAYEGMKP